MKKFFGIVASLIVLFVVTLLVFASQQPAAFRIQRSIEIHAPMDKVFELVNKLPEWEKWDPWKATDPDAVTTYGDITQGRGATSQWNGKKVGKGSMVLVDSSPGERIRFELKFIKPFEAEMSGDFLFLQPDPENPNRVMVSWALDGVNKTIIDKFFYKVMNVKHNCESDFDRGLKSLKAVAEAVAAPI